MTRENIQVVERAIEAINERDLESYLACCTEDIQLHTPVTAIEGAYEGRGGIKRFFDDIGDAGPDFRVTVERLEAISADRVLGFLSVTVSGRASGIDLGTTTANVYDLVDGRINRIRIFLDRREALEAVGLRE